MLQQLVHIPRTLRIAGPRAPTLRSPPLHHSLSTSPLIHATAKKGEPQLAPLELTIRTPFGPYSETHPVPVPVVRAVEALGPKPGWDEVQRVLMRGKFGGMRALALSFESNAAEKEVQNSLEWERDLAKTVASLALHASSDLQEVDDLKRHEHYAAATRKLHEARDEFNFSKWWALWKKTLQNERDLFWEKLMAAIDPTKEQRAHLVFFSLGGRTNMIHLAHHDLADVFDLSILRPEQVANLRAFLSHHGALIVGIEEVLYARFRDMMRPVREGEGKVADLENILGKDEKELARELYFDAMEQVPREEGEGSREDLLDELMAAYAWL